MTDTCIYFPIGKVLDSTCLHAFIITSSDYPGRLYLHGPVGLYQWQHSNPLGLRFVRIVISFGLRTKRLCSTRGQKTGFSVRGAKQRPSSLPAFFQSISLPDICAISFCITEEKSEMPEISCMAFFFFVSLFFEAGGFVVRFCKPPRCECWDSPVIMGFLWLYCFGSVSFLN